jgi:Type IV secretion system pilin
MIKKLLIISILAVSFLIPITTFAAAPKNPLQKACEASTGAYNQSSACLDSRNGSNPLFGSDGIINKVANGVALVAGAIAVIYMILGGLRMITSTGESQAFKDGRSTLIYAAVGLVVVSLARAIVGFILGRLS